MARRQTKSPKRSGFLPKLLLLLVVGGAGYYAGDRGVFEGAFNGTSGTFGDIVAEQVQVPITKLRRSLQDLVAEFRQFRQGGSVSVPSGRTLDGWVERVSDGDTLRLAVAGQDEITVRLYGIDAPESKQSYGDIAAQALARKVDGARVSAVTMDTDRYGRVVAKIFRNGENINLQMVAEGHAWWYEDYARDEQLLADAEREARTRGRGLWAERNPTEPWVWRRESR